MESLKISWSAVYQLMWPLVILWESMFDEHRQLMYNHVVARDEKRFQVADRWRPKVEQRGIC